MPPLPAPVRPPAPCGFHRSRYCPPKDRGSIPASALHDSAPSAQILPPDRPRPTCRRKRTDQPWPAPDRSAPFRLLDVSRGFEDVAERFSDQIDHGDEGMGVSVASCPGASGLEDTVERLPAGVAISEESRVG